MLRAPSRHAPLKAKEEPPITRRLRLRGGICVRRLMSAAAMSILSASVGAASDCTSSCDSDYWACTNTSSVSTCSHYRSMCYQRCTLSGPALQYGAIAYSPSANKYGIWAGAASQTDAEAGAVRKCRNYGGNEDCKPVWFATPNCGALATGPNRWGSEWGASRDEAKEKALAICGNGGSVMCAVEAAVCATDQLE